MNVNRNVIQRSECPSEVPICPNEINIFKTLLRIMKQSYKIPDKLLDDQKKIILSKQLVREIISQLLNIPEHDFTIYSSASSEEGCCGFSTLIEDVEEKK